MPSKTLYNCSFRSGQIPTMILLLLICLFANAQIPAYDSKDSTIIMRPVFAYYDSLFAKASHEMPHLLPWIDNDRTKIMQVVRKSLAIKDEWIPKIVATPAGQTKNVNYNIEHLQSTSWDNCYGAAHLYMPAKSDKKPPIVLLACGHGEGGKVYTSYRLMAENLASNGIAVLVPDNIGQGERSAMGHFNPVGVFDCGLTVQGLIVMETIGWLDWIHQQNRFDKKRVAVCGNSGGGTLGLFLSSVVPDKFSVLVSSGYPSSFEYVARKEKVHCRCNIIPGIVGKIEMWQALGCFAPKPMYILQGKSDEFFPADLFYQVSRNVGDVYQKRKAAEKFQSAVFDGAHGWDEQRIRKMAQYLCNQFSVAWNEQNMITASTNVPAANCYDKWPEKAIDINQLAEKLTGKKIQAKNFFEIFPPSALPRDILINGCHLPGGDCRNIFAQFEAFLGTK